MHYALNHPQRAQWGNVFSPSTIFEFIGGMFRDIFATQVVFVSQPFEDGGRWTIVHGTAGHVKLRQFKSFEDAADEFSAIMIASRLGEGIIQACEVDVVASVRVTVS